MAEHRYAGDEDWPQTAKTCRYRLEAENRALRVELAESRPRLARYTPDFSTIDGPHAFLQWKGTDVCLDFYCECGEQGHFDGYFAYTLRCWNCRAEFDLPHSVSVVPTQRQEFAVVQDVEP